jgi:2-polyprenyl-3-methyl-5-hydroxy-6-metoxy-1,4-benzoquinol methylase
MTIQSMYTAHSNAPNPDWPPSGLERVLVCPICASDNRREELSGLEDRVFACAPGKWTLHKCLNCGSAYLDPRPDRNSIGLAYRNYFTHGTSPKRVRNGLITWLRQGLANSYRNRLFGTQLRPSIPAGWVLSSMARRQSRSLRLDGRGLDLIAGLKGKLLDVGCGDGEFLGFAKKAGWQCFGIEPDAAAVSVASTRGADIIGSHLDELEGKFDGYFDVITLSHVIEHVHNPVDFCRRCWRMLKPGGFLWIETPNIVSFGYEIYSRSWRGLEPPRHLVLFTPESLTLCLANSGFADIRILEPRDAAAYTFLQSALLSAGHLSEVNPGSLSRSERAEMTGNLRTARKLVQSHPERSEFINIIAYKMENG